MRKAFFANISLLICTLSIAFTSLAQIPVLKINDKEDPNVYLKALKIDVSVIGTIATTTMEMTFQNKTNQILEGELIFPLPEGVSVSRYALDINGKMREAVPVEKARATEVFENIQRRRVDPGLLEKIEGNNFRTRIYPIPARGSRTILLSYEEELAYNNKRSLRYHLPLDFKKPVDHFKLHVQVLQSSVKPELEEDPGDISFNEWNNNYTASLDKNNFTANESLTFNIPKSTDNAEVMLQKTGANYYFFINLFLQKEHRTKQLPHEITIIWDASLSGINRDIKKELQLLDRYFKKNGNLLVSLALLNNTFKKANEYKITNGDWSELKKAIEKINYDGGTDYSKIWYPAGEEYLFFTDGMSSLGGNELKLPNKPVYTITSSPKSDFSYLQYIAQKTGGSFINLNELKTEDAEKILTQQPLQFIGIKQNNTISETYPSIPTPVINNFSMAGIATETESTIVLQFGYGTMVTYEKTISFDAKKHGIENIKLQRLWAQKKIAELEVQYEKNKQLIGLLGKQFSIVTRNTSLIVLETVQDYVQYEIEPPAELREQYDRIMKDRWTANLTQQQLAMSNALRYMDNLMTWWDQDYKPVFIVQTVPVEQRNPVVRNSANADSTMLRNRKSPPAMQEVVVVGFATKRKRNVVGSVSSIRSEELNPTSIQKSLEGRAAGVTVSKSNARTRYAVSFRNNAPKDFDSRETENEDVSTNRIDIKQWTPERTYLKTISKANKENRYEKYLQLRSEYIFTPVFYFDMANYFFAEKDTATALMILTNMAEIDIENYELYKLLGYKLKELREYETAVHVFRKILDWRPQEPHSYRDYGLALADAGKYQQALDTFYTVLSKNYNQITAALYPGFEEIMVTELNQLIALYKNELDISKIDNKLIHAMPVDVRVVLNWNKNNTDIDLWVTDPNDERCYFSHKQTAIGGRMSNDFTRGYGPEQFLLKKAIKGKYQVQVKYYGDSQFIISGPTTVMAEIFIHYGQQNQQKKIITLQMEKDQKEGVMVGEFEFKE